MAISSILNSAAHVFGLHVSRLRNRPVKRFIPSSFHDLFDSIADITSVPKSGLFDTYNAVQYAVRSLDGVIVECGVWKGGSAVVMANAAVDAGDSERQIYLYDTFAGMTRPTEADFKIDTGESAEPRYSANVQSDHCAWTYSPIDEVRRNLRRSGMPEERFTLVKGKVEDTIPEQAPDKIAVLRLDTDWYESTLHELNHLFPRLVTGGVLIADDYGYWAGARKAVDEYFEQNSFRIHFHQNADYGAIVGIKQ